MSSGAGSAPPLSSASGNEARITSGDWDKQWSFEINELRTKPREQKARGFKRKEAAAAVISILAATEGDDSDEAEEEGVNPEDADDLVGEEEEEEEEPGDYTNSYFDNGEEELNEETEREDE